MRKAVRVTQPHSMKVFKYAYLPDPESVMCEIAARVPSGLRRIPDGETGDRGGCSEVAVHGMSRWSSLSWRRPSRPAARRPSTRLPLPKVYAGAEQSPIADHQLVI